MAGRVGSTVLQIPLGVQVTRLGSKELTYRPESHTQFIGVTGSGKSTLLYNTARLIIENGDGICLIDPKGDLAEEVIASIPSHRLEDVIYIAPFLSDKEISLNPLAGKNKEAALQHLLYLTRTMHESSWGAQTDEVLNVYGTLAIKAVENPTFIHIWKAILVEEYAETLSRNRRLNAATKIAYDKYRAFDKRQRSLALAPPSNKLGFYLPLRHILAQPDSLDFRSIMDNRKIVICNVAKGRIGDKLAAVLGSIITNKVYFATMERAKVAPSKRPRFYLMIDEYRDFTAGNPTEIMLAQGRGLGLSVISSDQRPTADIANFQNIFVGNIVDPNDAEFLAKILGTTADFLHTLPPYGWVGKQYHVRDMCFDAYPSFPKRKGSASKEAVIRHSYENYGRKTAEVDRMIDSFLRGGDEGGTKLRLKKGGIHADQSQRTRPQYPQ